MKKCYNCDQTKGLKAIQFHDCDCGKCQGLHNRSTCKLCYFSDMVSCDYEYHTVLECMNDTFCENHKHTKDLFSAWDDFDYNYRPKKRVKIKQ